MFSFRKTSKKQRRELFIRFASVLVAGILLELTAYMSMAWFSQGSEVSGSGMQVAVSGDSYELLIERRTEYDRSVYSGITGSGGLKEKLSDDGYSLTASSTSDSQQIAYELYNEFEYEGTYDLMPGAYGELILYLRPYDDSKPVNATFHLDVGGYYNRYVTDDDINYTKVLDEVTNEKVLDLINGHILFFTGREGTDSNSFKYTGHVENMTFSYSTEGKSKSTDPGKTDCYKIVLYWEWPVTYYLINDNISTNEMSLRYPPELRTYITNNRHYFFALNFETDDLVTLSDGYDDADQLIGNSVDYVVVHIKPQ